MRMLLFFTFFLKKKFTHYPIKCILLGFKTSFKVENVVYLTGVNQFCLTGNSFRLDQFQVHTGRTNRIKGSEHSIDEEFHPMEVNPNFLKILLIGVLKYTVTKCIMLIHSTIIKQKFQIHMVFHNAIYPDVKYASYGIDGLVVIGIFVQVKQISTIMNFP